MKQSTKGKQAAAEAPDVEELVGWDRNWDPLEEARDILAVREHEKKVRQKKALGRVRSRT